VATGDTSAVQIFAPMASGTTALLYAVWGTSATNVYAVGSGGAILHFDGSSWASMASGTSSNLYAVWGSSATDVFAVGFGGTILHYDGSLWAPMASGSSGPLNGVWGASPVDVYAVGYQSGTGAAVLHWDGTAWSSRGSPTSYGLSAIWGTSASDVYAVASTLAFNGAGTLMHFDGASWTVLNSVVSLASVWGASASAVFVVGFTVDNVGHPTAMLPKALRWDGAQWRTDSMPSTAGGVWGTSASNVYAVGSGGGILRWNGARWGGGGAPVGAQDLKAAWGASPAEVFAVGAGGTILRSVPGGTIAVTPASATLPASGGSVQLSAAVRDRAGSPVTGVALVWTSSDSSVAVPDSNGSVTAARAGTAQITAMAQGGASASATITVSSGMAIAPDGVSLSGVGVTTTLRAVDGQTVVGAVAWASLNPAVATVSGTGVVIAVAAGQATISATANGVTAYALVTVSVPEAAPVTHWTAMTSGTTVTLRSVWGASATDVYAVGDGALVLHYDGTAWSPVSSGAAAALQAIWGASASEIFVAGTRYSNAWMNTGDSVHVGRWNGSTWSWQVVGFVPGPYPDPQSLWGASPHAVFLGSAAPGSGPLQFDGTRWGNTPAATLSSFSILWGTSAANVYSVFMGSLRRYDGSSWTPMATIPYPSGSWSDFLDWGVWGTSASDVYAVSGKGTIVHYDGSTWSSMAADTTTYLKSVWGASATNVYAVGTRGAILHFDGSSWSPMTTGTTATLYGIWGTTPTTVFVVGENGTILQGTP